MKEINNIPQSEWHSSQRGYFSGALHNEMITNKDIYVVTADLGFGQFDKIRDDFPDRFINVGAAEMCALDVSIGLALEGKIPFMYTITSFFMRCAEPIAIYLEHEQIPVILVGGGRDNNYESDGVSHHGFVTQKYIEMLGIDSLYPQTNEEAANTMKKLITSNKPYFISLSR